MKIERFEDLECWKQARILVVMVYKAINESCKFSRDYKIKEQVTSAAVSVMSNIAEGFSRQTNKEFIQFLYISKASASELQSIFYVAEDLGYINKDVFRRIYDQSDKVAQINSGLSGAPRAKARGSSLFPAKFTSPVHSTYSAGNFLRRPPRGTPAFHASAPHPAGPRCKRGIPGLKPGDFCAEGVKYLYKKRYNPITQ